MSSSQHRFYTPHYAQSKAAAVSPLRRAATFLIARAGMASASLSQNPRWNDVKWSFAGNPRFLTPAGTATAAAAAAGAAAAARFTVTSMAKPSIQFIRGVDELSVPDVGLTRSKDGLNGVATFVFDQPSVFDSSKELGDITGLYLVDEEGVLTSVDVSAKFVNGKPAKIEAKYVMKNISEWDRFMRFMERYATANNLGFVKK